MLDVCEIFKSIQGESTYAGEVCSFVRLSGCNLACSYCDTSYAREPGVKRSIDEICAEVSGHGGFLVEVTGGEPLVQEETPALCERFLEMGHTVLVETNGSLDIGVLPRGAVRIMDVKCPSSGVADRFRSSNIEAIRPVDECKFVLSDLADYVWARSFVLANGLTDRCEVIFSPNMKSLPPRDLARWIIDDKLGVRLGLQIHKFIWGENERSV